MSAPASPAAGARARRAVPGTIGRVAIAATSVIATAAIVLELTHSAVPPRAAPLDPNGLIAGQTLQQARCSNWLRASAADKAFAVQSLAAVVGSPTEYNGVTGTTLTPAQTYQLLGNACSNRIARNFLLYELYIRAAAFSKLARP